MQINAVMVKESGANCTVGAKSRGALSEPIIVQTDVRGPSAPRIANLTCHNADTLFLQWHRPSIYNKSIDLYYIYYRYSVTQIVHYWKSN